MKDSKHRTISIYTIYSDESIYNIVRENYLKGSLNNEHRSITKIEKKETVTIPYGDVTIYLCSYDYYHDSEMLGQYLTEDSVFELGLFKNFGEVVAFYSSSGYADSKEYKGVIANSLEGLFSDDVPAE